LLPLRRRKKRRKKRRRRRRSRRRRRRTRLRILTSAGRDCGTHPRGRLRIDVAKVLTGRLYGGIQHVPDEVDLRCGGTFAPCDGAAQLHERGLAVK
jgi:hypothetical protein